MIDSKLNGAAVMVAFLFAGFMATSARAQRVITDGGLHLEMTQDQDIELRKCSRLAGVAALDCYDAVADVNTGDVGLNRIVVDSEIAFAMKEAGLKKSDVRVAHVLRTRWAKLVDLDAQRARSILPTVCSAIFRYATSALSNREDGECIYALRDMQELKIDGVDCQSVDHGIDKGKIEHLWDAAQRARDRRWEQEEAAEVKKYGPHWNFKVVCGGVSIIREESFRAKNRKDAIVRACTGVCRGTVPTVETVEHCMSTCQLGDFGESCEGLLVIEEVK